MTGVYTVPDFGPSDLMTGEREGTRRIATDSQPSSFKDNRQYRFFDELAAVPSTSQLVYKFSATNPINIFLRVINLWSGGRKYLVYPADGNETFTGVFASVSDQLFPTNGRLRFGLTAHPATGATVQKAIGPDIFTSTSKPRNGTAMMTDGNANRASSAYTSNGDRGGISGGQSFYLVFDHIGASNDTNGLFLVAYEESFPE
jgi:hypothetical protein